MPTDFKASCALKDVLLPTVKLMASLVARTLLVLSYRTAVTVWAPAPAPFQV